MKHEIIKCLYDLDTCFSTVSVFTQHISNLVMENYTLKLINISKNIRMLQISTKFEIKDSNYKRKHLQVSDKWLVLHNS